MKHELEVHIARNFKKQKKCKHDWEEVDHNTKRQAEEVTEIISLSLGV